MIDSEGFRPNVGIILANDIGQVLWAKRIGHNAWQFPQGGIQFGETPEQALFRELREEVGLLPEHVQIIAQTDDWLHYRLPLRYIRSDSDPICIGQKQKWFLLKLTASTKHIHLAFESLENHVNQVSKQALDVCSIYLLDERNQRYVLMATKGLNQESVGNVSLQLGEGLVGLVGQREEIVNLDNAFKHERFAYFPETGEEIYNSFLGVPVMYRRKVMGVMVVQNTEPQDFSEAAESFLVTLCAQLSGVIAHAHAVGNIDVFRKPITLITKRTQPGPASSGAGECSYRDADDISEELKLLDHAIASVREEIQSLDDKMQDSLMAEERALFSVFLRMLDENALPTEIKEIIRDGSWAQGAVKHVIDRHVALFAQMEDDYLRERVSDLKDLGRRILAALQEGDTSHKEITSESILIGDEISTAALVELPVDKIAAIVTSEGAANSHMVIVARALGIPTVVGVTELPVNTLDDVEMIVDAYQGRVFVNPPRRLRTRYKEIQKEEEQIAKDLKQYETKDAITPDGVAL
ncbi:hypothetical protein FQR65_LT15861 [Abscondita terminalis]|nr:hypothetical protein FQR65_LT15861 [Abscondita terminalis]